jgi:Ser/Thr protein kinase RdoA (MazF antagonist)
MQRIIDITRNFQIPAQVLSIRLQNSGHIHDTYSLETSNGSYILQEVNTHVFPKPDLLTENIQLVSAHLRVKAAEQGFDPERATLNMVPTTGGDWLHNHTDDSLWRMFDYIHGTSTYQTPETGDQVYQAGRAVGEFICLLADFPTGQLSETIPNFHNTPSRFADFSRAFEDDKGQRVQNASGEINFVLKRSSLVSRLVDLLEAGELPTRVTHNDTKISNVLFDSESGEAVCMIDLDTVMPGTLLYDFGDACRTLTNTAAEDEPDLSLVGFNRQYFEQFSRGFVQSAGETLTALERELLPFSAVLMTLECGMRFLEDYLNGDAYFHTSRPDHNLQRARVQFRLVEEMEAAIDSMASIVQAPSN